GGKDGVAVVSTERQKIFSAAEPTVYPTTTTPNHRISAAARPLLLLVFKGLRTRDPSPSGYSVLSSPLSSPARRLLPLRRQSTPSARRRSATWRLRRGSPRAGSRTSRT